MVRNREGADQRPEAALEEAEEVLQGEVHQTPDDARPQTELAIPSSAGSGTSFQGVPSALDDLSVTANGEPCFAPPCLSTESSASAGATKDDEYDEHESPLAVLPGHLGHPEFCRRPCILFSAGNCEAGMGCNYCHLPHHRKVKLPQAIRCKLKATRATERLEILMQILRKKEAGMPRTLPSIQKLISITHEALDAANSSQASSPDRRAAQAVLAKMPVAALLGEFFTSDFDPEVRVCLQQELSDLRAQCAKMLAHSNP
ncbi:unnamed protein product [Symbiodinium sp. CCMP2592]|nr:unnamed protein product [Symbiodinium sp. CCMP2592]